MNVKTVIGAKRKATKCRKEASVEAYRVLRARALGASGIEARCREKAQSLLNTAMEFDQLAKTLASQS
jgi:hypothetical protein